MRLAEIRISSGTSGRRYLSAFPTRFVKTCSSWTASAITVGSGSTVTDPPMSAIWPLKSASASATARRASTGPNGRATVSSRENWRRSRIRACIRLPPSTMNSMYSSASGSSCPLYRRSRSWLKLTIVRSGSCRSWDATYANRCSSSFDRRRYCVRAGQRELGLLPFGDVVRDGERARGRTVGVRERHDGVLAPPAAVPVGILGLARDRLPGRRDGPDLLHERGHHVGVHAELLPRPADKHPPPPADRRGRRLAHPEVPAVGRPEVDPVRDAVEDGVEEPALPVVLDARPDELLALLPEFLLLHLELLRRRLGVGPGRLEGRDVLPDREGARDRPPVPDRGGRGEDVHRPAVRGRDHDRDVDRLLARERPRDGHIGREQRSAAVQGMDVEDPDHRRDRTAGERSAGERVGQVVRRRDPAVGPVDECGLSDRGEEGRMGRAWIGRDAVEALRTPFSVIA